MGLIVLDAGVVIGFLDAGDAHHDRARAVLRRAVDDGHHLVLPASALAEILVGPSRSDPAAVAVVHRLLEALAAQVVPLGPEVAEAAAALRARHPALKLPDALVVATAVALDADELVTTDRRWPARSRLGLRGALTRL